MQLRGSSSLTSTAVCQYWDGGNYPNFNYCLGACVNAGWKQACYSGGTCRCGINCVGGSINGYHCW